jgi:predicted HNH restriction endonuclease
MESLVHGSDSTVWLFQANPDRFDIDGYLANNKDIVWTVKQHVELMRPGQAVYLWRNEGKSKAVPGIVALCVLTSPPMMREEDAASLAFWRDADVPNDERKRVSLRVIDHATPKRVVKAKWLVEDPTCQDLPNFRMRQHVNYPLTVAHANRLGRLWSRTGVDFDRTDLLLALRAYADTFGGVISEKPGQPVANAALLAGRAVSGMYAKVMNFRSHDPRSAGAGQSNSSELTRQVWDEFWTGEAIDRERLDRELNSILQPGSESESLRQLEAEAREVNTYSQEGGRRLVTHFRIERDRAVVDDAKAFWRNRDPYLHCDICRMSFLRTYGEVGDGYIEAHHLRPISELDGPVVPSLDDLLPVCANCHRMLHRNGGCSVEELRDRMGNGLSRE